MLRSAILIAASAALTTITLVAIAGPLTPPAGPPVPTFKTLDEVKPGIPLQNTGTTIQISTPGFYYLTEDVSSRAVGILITTPGVTLDLNGFAIIGNLSGNSSHHGIQVLTAAADRPLTIRGGTIQNFSGTGILCTAGLIDVVLEAVHVSGCSAFGIEVAGDLTAHNCSANTNGLAGFRVFGQASITSSAARDNGTSGFEVEAGSIDNSHASGNAFDGFRLGFLVANQGGAISVSNCTATDNGEHGIFTSGNATLLNTVADGNGGVGFLLTGTSTVSDCIAAFNTAAGFELGSGSAISNSSSRGNALGFLLGLASTASNCSAIANTNEGFLLLADSRAFNCTADQNGTGFRGTSDTTIDSCTATDNTVGIVGGNGGLVIRSTAAGNATAFDFTNSDHGPIVDLTTSSGAIAATNPFSNFVY